MLVNEIDILLLLLVVAIICVVGYAIYAVFRSPFSFPYFIESFDVSGKRNVDIEDLIDKFILEGYNWEILQLHKNKISAWKIESDEYINMCILKKYRRQQYHNAIDDRHAYIFKLQRTQTRYRQRNYVKTPYHVTVTDCTYAVDWEWLENRYKKLEEISFETTLKEYNSSNQRKLMTPDLRKKIMVRDNYTCQECGKYMPDEVGLHIDHIIPIAKGGKSTPSNLRVLCSKCNGRKGAK